MNGESEREILKDLREEGQREDLERSMEDPKERKIKDTLKKLEQFDREIEGLRQEIAKKEMAKQSWILELTDLGADDRYDPDGSWRK